MFFYVLAYSLSVFSGYFFSLELSGYNGGEDCTITLYMFCVLCTNNHEHLSARWMQIHMGDKRIEKGRSDKAE